MLLRKYKYEKKSLSGTSRRYQPQSGQSLSESHTVKALPCVRLSASLTVEAAFAAPFAVLAAAMLIGLFCVMGTQIVVSAALHDTAAVMAASWTDAEKETGVTDRVKARLLFQNNIKSYDSVYLDSLVGGEAGISLLKSEFDGSWIILHAEYRIALPVTFGKWSSLPVRQQVACRKWIGASFDENSQVDSDMVYVTPYGTAYHSTTDCSYLNPSIRRTTVSAVSGLRSLDGSIYYACSCVQKGQTVVYVTDYGTNYHGDLACSGLKRTTYLIPKSEVGNRHACSKCVTEGN